MTIFNIKMKIRARGGALGQEGGALGLQGAPPCYSSLWGNTTACVTFGLRILKGNLLTISFIGTD